MSLEVVNLCKSYGKQKALDNLSFSAKEGEIIGLLGPNGAGKTTTFKMLTGFIEPTSGIININGKPMKDDPTGAKRSIGYLPESNPLYTDMYILEYLKFIADSYGLHLGKGDLIQLCSKVGLENELSKKIKLLSKGYKQRVGLAQSIIHDPQILILDEPTTGLDANQLVEIRSLIKQLGKSKLILFSSHIMQEIEAICDRVIILDKGVKVADNRIGTLTSSLEKGMKILLMLSKPSHNIKSYKKLKGVMDVESQDGQSIKIVIDHNSDPRTDIFHQAVKNGDVIIHLSKEDLSFESTFQKLTGKI